MKSSFDDDSGVASTKQQNARSEENMLMAVSRFMFSQMKQSKSTIESL